MSSRGKPDPFGALSPVLAALGQAPLPPALFVSGDDDWIVAEGVRRATARFSAAFGEGEVAPYDGSGDSVKEAVADAATFALFSTNRLVTLDATEVLRKGKLSAEELDGVLDEAAEARPEGAAPPSAALLRAARRAHALASAAGIETSESPAEAARRLAGRVRRSERARELEELLALPSGSGEAAETAAGRLVAYVEQAAPGDNSLLVFAVSPDAEHGATAALRRIGPSADLSAAGDEGKRARLVALGVERALDRNALVEPEVFDVLTERGRLSARLFLLDLDRLIDITAGKRITAEDAFRQVDHQEKAYGSDFVEAVAQKKPVEGIRILERLLAGGEFTAFRPWGGKEEAAPARKGPRGDAAFFPILGLLAGELRRMLALKAALEERSLGAERSRRADYRTFADRVLPALKAPRAGLPAPSLEGHPFLLHKSYLASLEWTLGELSEALAGLSAVDRGVKGGGGSGPELLEGWLLARAAPRGR